MDNETIKWFASLGVGGALGGFIFYFYRKDHISSANILFNLVKDNIKAMTTLTEVVRDMRLYLSRDSKAIRIWPAETSEPKDVQQLYEGKDGC